MSTVIKEFDAVKINSASIQFYDGITQQNGTPFGLLATLEGETEMKEFVKKVEGVEVKKITKPLKQTIKLSGHMPVSVIRDVFGISNEGLKPGVYSYGKNSINKKFVFTANVIDEFENLTKLIAYPNCTASTGLAITVDNEADELAAIEMEFTALADDLGNFYYEAFADEVDETVKTTWHTQFNSSLVKAVVIP